MASNICLFIKPYTTLPEAMMQQQKEFRNIVKPAIEQAGLVLLELDQQGIVVKNISSELIKQIYETDIVVVDANCYETTGIYTLSPFLYYFIGLRHALGNRTILITRSTDHLAASLQRHHTLVYSPEEPPEFYEKFKKVVRAIQSGEDTSSDNPFQEYRLQKDLAEQLARARAEANDKAAQLERLERERAEGSKLSPKITFRRVN